MLCRQCQTRGQWRTHPRSHGGTTATGNGLGSILCTRCGAILASVDPTDVLLETLAQLAGFGLSSGQRALLVSKDSVEPGTA